MASTIPSLPHPRPPGDDGVGHWYRTVLGWTVAEGSPVTLATGIHFDVLEMPAAAGAALLRRAAAGPVALQGGRMRLLVAAGSAEELPGLLDWLDWGGVALDLTATGAGGRTTAPAPPGRTGPVPRGAARWLRPPGRGRGAELPVLAGLGGSGDAPDLVRLVAAAATECHRLRLLRTGCARAGRGERQPLAFS
ncbi:SCO3374 family protein [Streptomyces zhihengii]|uniref:SCO3374 family protein n=1 Tax=Streptomyces zhihengii TaxID=1818004 RepID=UPI0036BB245D